MSVYSVYHNYLNKQTEFAFNLFNLKNKQKTETLRKNLISLQWAK